MGTTEFAQDYFGIVGVEPHLSVDRVIAAEASPLIRAFGSWQLIYPYLNWSDTLLPGPKADVFLIDKFGQIWADRWFRTRWLGLAHSIFQLPVGNAGPAPACGTREPRPGLGQSARQQPASGPAGRRLG